MKKDPKEYDVFISYSRKDYVDEYDNVIPGNIISDIKVALKTAGISYWIDEEANYVSEAWAKFILNCIRSSKVIVFVASKNANQSEWTRKEIAAANEFKKPIIPFRIDDSNYDEDVFLRLVDLQYIAHYKNPDTSCGDLIEAVKSKLSQIKEKEDTQRKKKEEERRQAEEKERRIRAEEEERKQKEQQQIIIEEIRLSCSKLNNEETKLEVDRNNLLLETKLKVKASAEQEKLLNDIISSSPIRKKSEHEIQQLKNERDGLKIELKSLQQEKDSLSDTTSNRIKEIEGRVIEKEQLATSIEKKYQAEVKRLQEQLGKTEGKLSVVPKDGRHAFRWWTHLSYLVLLGVCILGWMGNCSQKRELRQQSDNAKIKIEILRDSIKKGTTITTNSQQFINIEVNSRNLGKYLYEGSLNTEGKPEGKGKAVFPNKDTFEGDFAKGMLTEGRYTFAKDGTYFIGSFNEKEEPDLSRGAYYNKSGKKIN